MREEAFISIGSNLQPEIHLPRAMQHLSELGNILARSNVYQCEAIGAPGTPDFLNAAVLLQTTHDAGEVRTCLRAIEATMGRIRENDKFVARPIDLDLCFLGTRIESNEYWALPHPEVTQQAYVALPLAELSPDFVHPAIGRPLRELADELKQRSLLTLRPDVILTWSE